MTSTAEILSPSAVKEFADWINKGPALAKAAGCYVEIKVHSNSKPMISKVIASTETAS